MTDYWVLIFFNLLFTSAPPVIYGVLEKDVSAETLLQLPELYQSGQKSEVGDGQNCQDPYTSLDKATAGLSTICHGPPRSVPLSAVSALLISCMEDCNG